LISETGICTRCRQRSYHFTSHFSLFEYRDQAQELLILYKFENRRRIGLSLADLLAPAVRDKFSGIPLVPVPYRKKARRARGWDPIGEICRLLRARHHLPVAPCLARKGGMPQKSLDFEQRLINLRGQIRLRRSLGTRKAVLLDDVFTTGATLDECARILREAGCEEVHAVTIAID
jgi:competence protein ComFC